MPRTTSCSASREIPEEREKLNSKSFGQNQGLAWSSDSSLWGNQVLQKSFGQNQGLAWSSDSRLRGNQVLKKVLDRTKALHGPRTQAYWNANYSDEESPRLKYCKRLRPVRVIRRWRNAPLFSNLGWLFMLRVMCPRMVTSYTA